MPLVYLVLVLLLVGFVLAGALWALALWLQGYLYNEPAAGLLWRAPAAGGAVMVVLALWCVLNYRLGQPGAGELPFDTWWNFSTTENYPPRPWQQFWSVKNGKETLYRRQTRPNAPAEYIDPQTRKPWSRESNGIVEAVVVEEGGQKVYYKLQLPPGGKFKPDEPARYVEEDGQRRVLTEYDVQRGQVTRTRRGLLLGYFLLNGLLLAVWFAGLWLLLRFQWPHALGLAVVLWVATMLVVLPVLTSRTKQAVDARPVPKETTATWSGLA
jgi:hypothetical protein